MKKIEVILIEDHPEYREVVELAVRIQNDMEMGGVFGSAEAALSRLVGRERSGQSIFLLDLGLPGMSGLDAIPLLLKIEPDARIIVLTQSNHEADVVRAISSGAAGYLLKSSSVAAITDGIRAVMAGESTLDPAVAKFLVRRLQAVLTPQEYDAVLTKRELEVLELIGEGLSKKEIAKRLEISSHTVRTHVVHVYEKMNVQNAPAAIKKAYQMGLLRP